MTILVTAAAIACAGTAVIPPPEAPPEPVPAPPREPPAPTPRQPELPPPAVRHVEGDHAPMVRVGLLVGVASAQVSAESGLEVFTPSGAPLASLRAGEAWTAHRRGPDVLLDGPGADVGPLSSVTLQPRDGGTVSVNGRGYRGSLELLVTDSGLTVVNQLSLEEYLPGVVGAEMGPRPAGDREALEAQAIVSRTYALRNRGRWASQGFDYRAGVSDQVYGGVTAENIGSRNAVEQTAGLIVTWNGQPIDAFFFSTCGGRTELGTEVFRGANPAYLRSVSDVAPDGTAYCSLSPRFHWREEFTGRQLRDALRRYLPAATSVAAERVSRIRDIRISSRTGSGRVRSMVVDLPGGAVTVPGPAVRLVLRDQSGNMLRSTLLTLRATHAGGEVTHLAVEGSGAGHGVGFCQWGAVGRARAGQDHEQIVAAYFPGTRIERAY
ncbi:MAG TPA: SpoIID/LytB domain-containing protein [Gemmatimonadales bacterium]|nr:SpoIID/LytB domain-containing protein [Gemmatimonadales bacterium]